MYAYPILSVRVGASIQQQLNHLQRTRKSADDDGGVSILYMTDKQQQTMTNTTDRQTDSTDRQHRQHRQTNRQTAQTDRDRQHRQTDTQLTASNDAVG